MSNFLSSSTIGRFCDDWKLVAALGQGLAWSAGRFSVKISGLAVPIEPIVPGQAQTGTEIYHGLFRFGGREIHSRGAMIFDAPISHLPWLEELHGFAWLSHLEASGLELARVHARALIWDWLDRKRYRQRGAGRLPVICRRLKSWIYAAPFLLHGADENFSSEFLAGLSRHLRDLQLRSALPLSTALRLQCAMALAFAAVALKGLEPLRSDALQLLSESLDAQILPDGGHASRSPSELVKILLDLLPLRLACEAARIELPAGLHAALERMLPMVRFFIHGDSGLAIFQGACDPLINECRAILNVDAVKGSPLSSAVYSRYVRLSHNDATVICDTGLPAGKPLNPHNATSPLAFEFSDADCRIVVNCGRPAVDGRLSAAAGLVEAHSTATLAVTRSEPERQSFFPRLSLSRSTPHTVEAQVDTIGLGSLLEAWHSLFESKTDYLHERRLFLSATGSDFRGEDRFVPTGDTASAETSFVVRFHLHPAVKATLSLGGTSVVLLLTNGVGWTFTARHAHIGLQESICLWGKSGPRKTMQIVLSGHTCGQTIHWAFKRCRRQPSPADDPGSPPTLPL